jgi:hypothetical protein
MDRARSFHVLRIVASILCLVACVFLTGMWARSYTTYDWLVGPLPQSWVIQASTRPGGFSLVVSGPAFRVKLWELSSYSIQADQAPPPVIFNWGTTQGRFHVSMPYLFLIPIFGTLGIVLGVRSYQFSLRTLLIGMTLVAISLGVIMALR